MSYLNQATRSFMNNNMCIDVEDVENMVQKINCSDSIDDIYSMLAKFHDVVDGNNVAKEILNVFKSFPRLSNNNNPEHEIADPLRHAFTIFLSGGLHQLFTGQENEAWYPKIILCRELRPNDIASLEKIINIYRGCNISEIKTRTYGQSWSMSETVAKQFAFDHYKSQSWFNSESRVVLKAKIDKSDVFYSDQNSCEKEIAVNSSKLYDVNKLCITRRCT